MSTLSGTATLASGLVSPSLSPPSGTVSWPSWQVRLLLFTNIPCENVFPLCTIFLFMILSKRFASVHLQHTSFLKKNTNLGCKKHLKPNQCFSVKNQTIKPFNIFLGTGVPCGVTGAFTSAALFLQELSPT